MSILINYNNYNVELELNVETGKFYDNVSNEDVVRYLKGIFTNKERFNNRFISKFRNVKNAKSFFPKFADKFFDYLNEDTYYPFVCWVDKSLMNEEEIVEHHAELNRLYLEELAVMTPEQRKELVDSCGGVPITFERNDCSIFACDEVLDELLNIYDKVKEFSYAEAFAIPNEVFQAKVFGSIDIVEMIKELGHERIATAGKHLRHKQFSKEGEFEGYVEYDVIYETHKVDSTKLPSLEGDNDGDVYALRCWCTTTDKEHWLWIEDEYKDDPLEAVAQTFRVHKNVIPHITEIKRQGDMLLVELDKEIKPSSTDEIVPLTAEQYFGFLTAQS